MTTIENEYYSVKDVCKKYSIKEATVRKWVSLGQVPYKKIGNLVRFHKKAFETWADYSMDNYVEETYLDDMTCNDINPDTFKDIRSRLFSIACDIHTAHMNNNKDGGDSVFKMMGHVDMNYLGNSSLSRLCDFEFSFSKYPEVDYE